MARANNATNDTNPLSNAIQAEVRNQIQSLFAPIFKYGASATIGHTSRRATRSTDGRLKENRATGTATTTRTRKTRKVRAKKNTTN